MKGEGEFKKQMLKWQKFVNDDIQKAIINEFPFGTKITKKAVAKLLVDKSWIEKVQLATYRSAVASGLDITFEEFKVNLTKQKMYDGKVINSWKNSYEPNISKKFVTLVNRDISKLNDRVSKLNTAELDYVVSVFKTVPTKSSGYKEANSKLKYLIANKDVLSELEYTKQLNVVREYISNNIKDVQYNAVVAQRTKSVLAYQGSRLIQDQFVIANNVMTENEMETKREDIGGKEDLILVGYWKLSPSHKDHPYPGGDPCPRFANHDAGYGKGSHVGDIPIPKKDTHFGCLCRLTLKVEKKK